MLLGPGKAICIRKNQRHAIKAHSDFEYIEIFYCYPSLKYYSSTKIYSPNGKLINMQLNVVNQSTRKTYIIGTSANVSGTTITPQLYGEYNATDNSQGTSNAISIYKVVGYK